MKDSRVLTLIRARAVVVHLPAIPDDRMLSELWWMTYLGSECKCNVAYSSLLPWLIRCARLHIKHYIKYS